MAGVEDVRFEVIDAGTRVGLLSARHWSRNWKWHHDQYAFGIAHSGGFEIATRGRSVSLTAGRVLLSQPDDVTICRKAFKPTCIDTLFVDAEFVRSSADNGLGHVKMPHIANQISNDPALVAALQRFLADASDTMPSLAQDEAFSSVIDVFLGACGQTVRKAGAEQRAVRQVRSILHEHLSETVRLEYLAATVGLNKSYLVRCFTRAVGVPPHAYQRLVRISRARRLLLAGESASDIAQQLGFADQSHFIRVFRQCTGMTPASYARARKA
jgi:AraC-like DNA-binding protein